MLAKVNNPNIHAEIREVQIDANTILYTKILTGPCRSGRAAIYIHGGGNGGNHTLIERPSRHLIDKGFFDTIILPDRRGDGGSSPLTRKFSVMEHAQDMHALLNELNLKDAITAMGVSYGGPIALNLAAIDKRVERVVLVASSPCLSANNGIARFLLKTGLLKLMVNLMMNRYLGKLPPSYTDFDPAYDAKSQRELVKAYTEGLKRTPKENRDSMCYALESTLDESQASPNESISLDIPVIQVVGESDEVWGSLLHADYLRRFPKYRQVIVSGGRIHKDVFLKPDLFQNKLEEALRMEFSITG
ncbi:MAG: alpha/beta hydrolase [Chloroflexi bacterium]|nr:alpha/beta hydrolase [Chloroflexota bacterium]